MSGLIEALVDGMGNLIGAVLIAPVMAAAEFGRRLRNRTKDNKGRSKMNEDRLDIVEEKVDEIDDRVEDVEQGLEAQTLRLLGDDDDPNNPGMLKSFKNLSEKVDHLDEKMERQHQDVSQKLDRITDSLDDEQVEAD